MLRCQICFELLPERFFTTLPCDCQCCQDCLVSWCAVKIKEPYYLTSNSIPCITGICNKDFTVDDIIMNLSLYHQSQLNNKLLQIYMSKAQDVRKCPRNNCPYGGVIETSSCSRKLQCTLCGKRWREKAQFSSLDNVKIFSVKWRYLRKELFSGIWKRLRTKRCPKCRIRIQKVGGCQHMTCERCKHEFCWICAKKHPKHSYLGHCASNPFKLSLMTFLFLIITLLILSTVDSIPQVHKRAGWILSPLTGGIRYLTDNIWNLIYWILSLVFIFLEKGASMTVSVSPEPVKTVLLAVGQVITWVLDFVPTLTVFFRLINSCITFPLLFLIRDIFLWIVIAEINLVSWALSMTWTFVSAFVTEALCLLLATIIDLTLFLPESLINFFTWIFSAFGGVFQNILNWILIPFLSYVIELLCELYSQFWRFL